MSVLVDETDRLTTTGLRVEGGTYISHALAQGQVDVGKLRGLMVLELHTNNILLRGQLIDHRRYHHVSMKHRAFGLFA